MHIILSSFSVDATEDKPEWVGWILNHSGNPNVQLMHMLFDEGPRLMLWFKAMKKLPVGTELLRHYGPGAADFEDATDPRYSRQTLTMVGVIDLYLVLCIYNSFCIVFFNY